MSEKTKLFKIKLGYRSYNLKTVMIERWQVVLLISLFWAGIFIGAFYINNAQGEIALRINSILSESFMARDEYTSMELFKTAVLKYGIFLFFSFFFGVSGFGYPVLIVLPVLSGIANGVMSGYLYTGFGVPGVFYCLLTIYPALVVSLVALITGICESMEMAKMILVLISDKHHMISENPLKKYIYQYGILTLIIVGSALLETILCHLFLGKIGLF